MCSLLFDSCSRPVWRHCTGQFDSRPPIYYFIIRFISTCRSHTHTHTHVPITAIVARRSDVLPPLSTGDWREQLHPLVTKLKDCVTEVVEKAKRAMTFVLLQEAACSLPQGFHLQQRRDVVFSQAVSGRSETTRGDPEVQMQFYRRHSTAPLDRSQHASYKVLWNVLELCNVSVLIELQNCGTKHMSHSSVRCVLLQLATLACGFVMRLYAGMQDKGFLRQLHQVGLVAQFESLLSTYSQ